MGRHRAGDAQACCAAVDIGHLNQTDAAVVTTQRDAGIVAAYQARSGDGARRCRHQAACEVQVVRLHPTQLQGAGVGQSGGVGHPHLGSQNEVEGFCRHAECGGAQTTIEGNRVVVTRVGQHHAVAGGHFAGKSCHFAVDHFQRLECLAATQGTLHGDGTVESPVEFEGARIGHICIHGTHEAHLALRLNGGIGEYFDDVVEHRGTRHNKRSLDVCLTRRRGQ